MDEAARARWRQYRQVWSYVEQAACRRAAILRHFGDQERVAAYGEQAADGCCDVCAPGLTPQPPPPDPVAIETLDDAILSVASAARPAVGRTLCAEILHGARTKDSTQLLRRPAAYGGSSHLRRAEIVGRVDELIEQGRLQTTGGPYPVLRLPGAAPARLR